MGATRSWIKHLDELQTSGERERFTKSSYNIHESIIYTLRQTCVMRIKCCTLMESLMITLSS